jgi:hypothetical protein
VPFGQLGRRRGVYHTCGKIQKPPENEARRYPGLFFTDQSADAFLGEAAGVGLGEEAGDGLVVAALGPR